jgi:TPR repeat protein
VAKDYKEALRWHRRAADKGFARAMYNLGRTYERGEGVKKDRDEALKWYRKAATLGHEKAKEAVKRLGPGD